MNIKEFKKQICEVESDLFNHISELSEDFFNETGWSISSIKIEMTNDVKDTETTQSYIISKVSVRANI